MLKSIPWLQFQNLKIDSKRSLNFSNAHIYISFYHFPSFCDFTSSVISYSCSKHKGKEEKFLKAYISNAYRTKLFFEK